MDLLCKDMGLSATAPHLGSTKTLYSPIGRLVSYFEEDEKGYIESTCTASLISDDVLLTAAQCVFDKDFGWAVKVLFYPSSATALEAFRARALSVPKAWTSSLDVKSGLNLATVVLSAKPGKTYGWYEVCSMDCLPDSIHSLEQVGYSEQGVNASSSVTPLAVLLKSSTHFVFGPNAAEITSMGIGITNGYVYRTTLGAQSIGGPLLKGKSKSNA